MLTAADLRRPIPPSWKLLVGGDTGTYMSAAFLLFPPDRPDVYVVEEFPNYRYIGGEIELLGESVPEWARKVHRTYAEYIRGVTRIKGWCDENSQFKEELKHYGLHFRGNKRKLELRVEITREYFNNRRVWLAPWLTVLPWELEHATWPDDTNSAGRFEREKVNDHTLDCVEHVLSRRPRSKAHKETPTQSFVQRELAAHAGWRELMRPKGDAHLGLH